MAKPTLQEVFGINANQDIEFVRVAKADLAAIGLTVEATNNAEELLVAILKKAHQTLTETSFGTNIDQSIVIAPGFKTYTTRGEANDNYEQRTYEIRMHKLDTDTDIDPDNY